MQIWCRSSTAQHTRSAGPCRRLRGVDRHRDLLTPKDNAEAVDAYEDGAWHLVLEHSLADIQRTRELTGPAGRFVGRSDFKT